MTALSSKLAAHGRRLPLTRLRRICEPEKLGFKSTAELPAFEGLIGQDRALEALDMGARIDKPGFNLFVLGERGTARHGTVRGLIEGYAAAMPAPLDWIYVSNFRQSDRPQAISVPPGSALKFKTAVDKAIDELLHLIPALFESEEYQQRRRNLIEEINKKQTLALEQLSEKGAAIDIALLRTPNGFSFAPVAEGSIMKPEVFNALPDAQRKEITNKIEDLQKDLTDILEQAPTLERERRQRVSDLDQEKSGAAIATIMRELCSQFATLPQLRTYLEDLENELTENAHLFHVTTSSPRSDEEPPTPSPATIDDPRLRRFSVNVLVANGIHGAKGAPVIVEDNPSIGNLVGRIEQQAQMGALFTDFTLIRPGSLHAANGGYLMVDARRLLLEPFAWEVMKRCLRARAITIESPSDRASVMTVQSLKPDPIPLWTKVILFGDRQLYQSLVEADPDFAELFKVAVDFEDIIDWSDSTVDAYAKLIGSIAQREGLRPLTAAAVARLIEELAREAEDASKLSLRIGALADRLREADFWAAEAGHKEIDARDIDKLVSAVERRHDRVRVRMQEMIERNIVLVDTDGEKTGQINGLSVLSLGSYSFGKPSRITATVSIGSGEIVNIEREVALSGPLHSKGVLILSSFLSSRYALDTPLSLHASLVFEQSYGGVDGDSASSTELYALLSALAGIPIRQGIAVTGSVNQRGEIQAIGGVNQKIEGYFDLCASRGLNGMQGVMIPKANEQHLMLNPKILDAVSSGTFHVFSVTTIDEGIELLTGIPAGSREQDGLYTMGSINRKVDDRLLAYAEARRKYSAFSTQS